MLMRLKPIRAWLAGGACLCICTVAACGKSGDASANVADGDWRASMKQVRLAIRGAEEDPAMVANRDNYKAHLEDVLGLPVTIVEPVDYNGSIQALSSNQVDMAQMGGGSYANVDAQIGELAVPILVRRQAEGNVGYYSALMVKADSPYQSIEDLKGKTLGYVDFNSTSGYLYPRMMMRRLGVNPDTFFGKTAFSGGHTQAIMALDRGQFDAVLVNVSGGTPETGFTTGSHYTMASRGLVDINDFRIVWSVGEIPNSPVVVRSDRPQEFIDIFRGIYALMPYDRPDLMTDLGGPSGADYAAVERAHYEDIIALREADIAERRGLAPEGTASLTTAAPGNAPTAQGGR